ncbi:bacillithiol system protein YtxJ [Pustulibacterium marinum]|uniref:Bacillithiol system protein YtxJ n=1 Tax=Pustulibacterium marinum TaxID=1224947 RepID=A0A1I7GYW2_9FLAO|nr:bacillithiol system redox-active protein YtxJ [Pustulibacterium marinum]SFU53605.1 bacillithiol system protein YtxJ [Pustulibacterium marinum]
MGIFNSIFGKGGNESKTDFPWNELNSIEQLDTIAAQSSSETVAIFKHSTSCGISAMVKRSFENESNAESGVKLYYLDLLANRPISNAVAEKFMVVHQSPQLIVLKNGEVVAEASHGAINDVILEQFA